MTPRFECEEPIVQFLPDGRNCRLVSRIVFYDSTGKCWVAEPGKETDGASIPRSLWALIGGPYEGRHRDGALLHDDAYSEAPANETSLVAADLSPARKAADRMLYEASRAKGTAWWKAWLIYHGVRLGGAFAWRGHARRNAAFVSGAVSAEEPL